MLDLEDIRREYLMGGLRRANLLDNPFDQFELWMKQAMASQIPDPTAMTLATVSASGQPSQRIVLLKNIESEGLVFYTNYDSAKAHDMDVNPKVGLHFPWHAMERQVKILGEVEKLTSDESQKYFSTRPRDSQIAAWASQQSRVVDSREALDAGYEQTKQRFADSEVPLPEFWGGYRVKPSEFEFWQGRSSRLHDRFVYQTGVNGVWSISRLSP